MDKSTPESANSLAKESEKEKKGLLKRPVKIWKFTLPLWLAVVVGCCIFSFAFSGITTGLQSIGVLPTTPTPAPTDTPPPTATPMPTDTPGPTNTPAPTEVPATDTPAPTPTQEIEGQVKEGTHLVGTDIEPGIYVGRAGEGLMDSCYWARLSNLTGSDDLLANDNAVGLYYVEVLPDDKALETACELLPIEQVPARDEFLTVLPPGTYLVGRDIEAGTYRGQAGDDVFESCYWARLSNVSGDDDILANDNATGQYFIEVLPTDFALKVGCEVEKVE